MSYQVTDANGVTSLRPDHRKMVSIVKAMYAGGKEDFDEVTMTHSTGVAISLYRNGSAVMDTANSEHYSLLENLSMDEQLMLWVQLAAGNLKSIHMLDWTPQA